MQHKKYLVYLGTLWKSLSDVPAMSIIRGHIQDNSVREKSMQNEEVLKIKDVAALLKVGEKTVYSMARTGELPAFKVRGQWRFSRKDIDSWIEQQKNTTQDI